MKRALLLSLLAAVGCAVAQVDWPLYRGNSQRTGSQPHEQILSTASLGKFQLLWKRKLASQPLSAPSILGRLISHRGFLELVFIADRAGNVFAVDDDLNRVFWTRHLPSEGPCGPSITAPMFPPLPGNATDSDEDNPYAPRPVYVVAEAGKLYSLSPMTGDDMSTPRSFLPSNANVSHLNYWNKFVYATTSNQCGGAPDVISALDTRTGRISTFRAPGQNTFSDSGVTIANDGTVYAILQGATTEIIVLTPGLSLKKRYPAPRGARLKGAAVFPLQGRDIVVAFGDRLTLLGGEEIQEAADAVAVSTNESGGTWLYASSKRKGITAFMVSGGKNGPKLKRAWTWDAPGEVASAPVAANGVVYALSARGQQTALYALNAASGRPLYEGSGNAASSPVDPGALSIANGHVCFGTQDGTLYCFGLPVDL